MSGPNLFTLAPFLAQRPPSAIGDAFAQLAQQLDPDRPHAHGEAVIYLPYDGIGTEPPAWGPANAIYLPEKAPSAEAWYAYVQAHFRDQIPPRPEETT
jgi:hypothetical protein